jgi:tetratricopeptide (TPR) repeat protein
MSILDGLPSTEKQLNDAIQFAAPILDKAVADANLPERVTSVLEHMKEGLSLADIFGITKQQREALLVQGCRFLQLGEIAKGRDILLQLYKLEPMDERTIYALATSYQLQQDFAAAGKLYVLFLALDATNPEGHLRLGECFLGAKEFDNAESSFSMARNFAKSAGDAAAVVHATKMLELTQAGRKATAS